MKTRRGFVANSSTSCFICEVCGDMNGGMDMGLRDLGFLKCSNGHVFCEEHQVHANCEEDKSEVRLMGEAFLTSSRFQSDYWKEDRDAVRDALDSEDDELLYELEDLFDDLSYELGVTPDQCPICTMTTITDKDLLAFIVAKHGWSLETLHDEMRVLGSYPKFKEYTKGK